jgi:hypothetical protein
VHNDPNALGFCPTDDRTSRAEPGPRQGRCQGRCPLQKDSGRQLLHYCSWADRELGAEFSAPNSRIPILDFVYRGHFIQKLDTFCVDFFFFQQFMQCTSVWPQLLAGRGPIPLPQGTSSSPPSPRYFSPRALPMTIS